jgi:hypothetical protein
MLWLIHVNAVFVMYRDHFLPDRSNRLLLVINKIKAQADDISSDLSPQAFYVRDVLYNMQ